MYRLHLYDAADGLTVLPRIEGNLTVGSADDNHVCLIGPSVEAHHARIVLANGGLYVQAFASERRSAVNGRPFSGYVEIFAGDVVEIGDYRLEFVELPQHEVDAVDEADEAPPEHETTPDAGQADGWPPTSLRPVLLVHEPSVVVADLGEPADAPTERTWTPAAERDVLTFEAHTGVDRPLPGVDHPPPTPPVRPARGRALFAIAGWVAMAIVGAAGLGLAVLAWQDDVPAPREDAAELQLALDACRRATVAGRFAEAIRSAEVALRAQPGSTEARACRTRAALGSDHMERLQRAAEALERSDWAGAGAALGRIPGDSPVATLPVYGDTRDMYMRARLSVAGALVATQPEAARQLASELSTLAFARPNQREAALALLSALVVDAAMPQGDAGEATMSATQQAGDAGVASTGAAAAARR